jgi:hypothetical protein
MAPKRTLLTLSSKTVARLWPSLDITAEAWISEEVEFSRFRMGVTTASTAFLSLTTDPLFVLYSV